MLKVFTSLDETAHNPGVVRIPTSRNTAGIGNRVVELHHELRWYFAMRQILALTPDTENLQPPLFPLVIILFAEKI